MQLRTTRGITRFFCNRLAVGGQLGEVSGGGSPLFVATSVLGFLARPSYLHPTHPSALTAPCVCQILFGLPTRFLAPEVSFDLPGDGIV